MKSRILNPADRKVIQALAEAMMEMNKRDDVNASAHSTYGYLYKAIRDFVENQTDISIGNVDWNLGGNATYADDIQIAIIAAWEGGGERYTLTVSFEALTVEVSAIHLCEDDAGEWAERYLKSCGKDTEGRSFITAALTKEGSRDTLRAWARGWGDQP